MPKPSNIDPEDIFSSIQELADLGARERNVLAAVCDVVEYGEGEKIIEQGSRPRMLPYLATGTVELIFELNDQEIPLATVSGPSLLGFLWILDTSVHCPVTFRVIEDSVCLNIRNDDFENLYDSGSSLSYPVLALLYREAARNFCFYNDAFRRLYQEPEITYVKLVKLAT
ncbi:MAG: hypothetical protein CMH54_01645 [Myxococcales bacterium]|nr:hypothetical protein [Myxococcales bacterium]|tara:strand:- start:1385 stop:1894 length:510 start_codon:yes stop_codon:yes gene_type:complete